MNKRTCASILSVHRSKPCTRRDDRPRILSSCTSPLSCSLICTFTHTNNAHRWLLLFVVMLFDLKELQIKFPV